MTSVTENPCAMFAACLISGEDAAREILELRDRIDHLEADGLTLKLLLAESLHALHAVTQERDQARRTIREMRTYARTELRAA